MIRQERSGILPDAYREDDVEVINFMNGGKSRSEIILSGEKTRPQSNTWNPFCYSTEAFTAETMQSMLPQNVQGASGSPGPLP